MILSCNSVYHNEGIGRNCLCEFSDVCKVTKQKRLKNACFMKLERFFFFGGGGGSNNSFKIATKQYLRCLMTLREEVRTLYLR